MSILIKGMEMPESCCECPCCDSVDLDCRITCDKVPWDIKDRRKPVWCPLIEIPPHGRLIDADAMKEKMGNNPEHIKAAITRWINAQPTIIEAEDGE